MPIHPDNSEAGIVGPGNGGEIAVFVGQGLGWWQERNSFRGPRQELRDVQDPVIHHWVVASRLNEGIRMSLVIKFWFCILKIDTLAESVEKFSEAN